MSRTSRLDHYLRERAIAVAPADQFPGLIVEVGAPRGWELLDLTVGMRVWICRTGPCKGGFCANAVLTMHRIEAGLPGDGVFEMLAEQQVQLVPGCSEMRRELGAATEGVGIVGLLAMKIDHELGTIDSESRSRIIATEQETLIAQLTVTALQDSPVRTSDIWLTVKTNGGR